MADFKSRLVDEKEELDQKINKLKSFIESDAFHKIDPIQKPMLIAQAQAMSTYSVILWQRLNHL